MKNNKKPDMENLIPKDIREQNREDIIEQSVKGEARFLKGLMEEDYYKSVWRLCLSYCWALFYFVCGATALIILIVGLSKAIQQGITPFFIISGIFILIISFLLLALSFKLIARIIFILSKKDKRFKIISFLVLLPFNLITIWILILIYRAFLSMNFIF